MLQWEIYNFPHPTPENFHPCVVLSPDILASSPQVPFVNVLACTSLRARDTLKLNEVRLNGADGLDGPTIVKCNFILFFNKNQAGARRGAVSRERQQAIRSTLAKFFGIYVR